MLYLVYTIHVVICLFLILVVLLQQGSGADLSVFGGGATQTAFGARSATSLLHRLTVAAFIGFIVTTIAIGFLKIGGVGGGSVMTDLPAVEESATAEEEAIESVADESEPVAGDITELTVEEPVDEMSPGAAEETAPVEAAEEQPTPEPGG